MESGIKRYTIDKCLGRVKSVVVFDIAIPFVYGVELAKISGT